MDRLSIPFNVDILILSDKAAQSMRPVTSIDPFIGATKNFNPDGLFSTEIFGVANTPMRYKNYSYIDLKIPIIHPTIYETLGQIRTLYADILARREFAVWDPDLKDFVKSNMIDGQTGFEFFCSYLDRIEFPNNESDTRQMAVTLMNKYRGKYLISKFLVIPAGYRDFEFDENGRESSSEINDFYYRLLAISNTINPSTLRTSPEAYNVQRTSMQNAVMELYALLKKVIEGKNNLLMGKMAGRKIFNGTRNVLTAMTSSIVKLGDPKNVSMNDTFIGLYQLSKAILPITKFRLRNAWLSKCFTAVGAPVLLCNKETLQSEMAIVSQETYANWISDEGLEKQITYYKEDSIRHDPVMIDDHYIGLVYRGPDKTFAFIHGIDQLPEGRSASDCTPITLTELLYHALYGVARKYKICVTRYPITGIGSIYPSNAYLKSTVEAEERRELDTDTWEPFGDLEHTAYEFPITESTFYNSMSPHSVKIKGLGADYDGDFRP
jgi:hypothetical protein